MFSRGAHEQTSDWSIEGTKAGICSYVKTKLLMGRWLNSNFSYSLRLINYKFYISFRTNSLDVLTMFLSRLKWYLIHCHWTFLKFQWQPTKGRGLLLRKRALHTWGGYNIISLSSSVFICRSKLHKWFDQQGLTISVVCFSLQGFVFRALALRLSTDTKSY